MRFNLGFNYSHSVGKESLRAESQLGANATPEPSLVCWGQPRDNSIPYHPAPHVDNVKHLP
jgi:hypothetical protein